MKHLILGNGPAGVIAAETLRHADPRAEILLVGNEDAPPYSRMAIPYLLEGEIDEAGTYLRKEPDHYERLRIQEQRGRAVALHTDQRDVLFDDGSRDSWSPPAPTLCAHPSLASTCPRS
jgi:NADPH-dependent 2,4-dienoyl-CoA reductase/sulfur reductase-like enzyme